MPPEVGKTPNPDFKLWQAKLDKVDSTLDKIQNQPNMHGPKWVASQVKYYNQIRKNLVAERPPKWLEDIGVEPLPSTPPPRGGGSKKR